MQRFLSPFACFILLGVFLLQPVPACSSGPQPSKAPPDVQTAIDYVFSFAEQGKSSGPDMHRMDALLAFVAGNGKDLGKSYSLGRRHGAVSDYYEFSIRRSLKDLLALVFNPDLPSSLVCPASMRRAHWIEIDGREQALPQLSEKLGHLQAPLVVRGREFIENSPDVTSGAYYSYELQRMLILARYQDRPLLISISIQPERSQVGRKGLVMGPDENWDYVYTGEQGQMMAGLGWADSYMYYSASIVVYLEMPETPAQVRIGAMKWIKAGWAGMNLVRPHHIREGVLRFAATLKEILESPTLPDVSELTRIFGQINSLSMDQLRAKNQVYLNCLGSREEDTNKSYLDWLRRLSRDGDYLQSLDREELITVVNLEYLKSVLGKPHCLDIEDVADSGSKKNPS